MSISNVDAAELIAELVDVSYGDGRGGQVVDLADAERIVTEQTEHGRAVSKPNEYETGKTDDQRGR